MVRAPVSYTHLDVYKRQVEARSSSGELLGFDRLAPLTLKSAREIADTARAFGQQDDITALTLARTA